MTADLAPSVVETGERRLSLRLSEDQTELASIVRSFLADVAPPRSADRAGWAEVDPTRAIWRRMAGELGLQGLAIPEDLGGQGFGLSEMTIVFEELGRALFAAPMLGSVGLAARTLLHAPASTVRDDALRGIASGALVAASTAAAPGGVTATAGGPAAGLLSGATGAVVDADHADLLVVVAATSDGSALYVVSAGAPGVLRETLPGIDLTRGSARVTFTDVHAELVAGPDAIGAALGRGLAEGTVLLASESVGGARAALEEAVAYSKVRSQFGRQIGSFQALKHRMADILIVTEGAWSTVRHAAVLADLVPAASIDELQLAASVAKGASSYAQMFAAGEDIQIHGGIGFTWEHPAHLRFRRAKASEVLLGLPQDHHERTVSLLGNSLAVAPSTDRSPHGHP